MRGIEVTVHQADGNTVDAHCGDLIYAGGDLGLIQRDHDFALCIDAFAHAQPALAGQEGFGQGEVQIVLLKPALGPHFDYVTKTLSGDQSSARAAPFDQGVGGKCGAVNDLGNGAGRDALGCTNPLQSLNNCVFRGGICREHFGGCEQARPF